jgi:hypothetical protein
MYELFINIIITIATKNPKNLFKKLMNIILEIRKNLPKMVSVMKWKY